MRKKNKRFLASMLVMSLGMTMFAGCGRESKKQEEETSRKEKETVDKFAEAVEFKLSVDTSIKHQTIEGFGVSGAWWSQMAGGWTMIQDNGLETREWIAQLLFDKEKGIGLNTYRYNLGAGSADSGNGDISDEWRRAQSFETAPGVYDFTKDANAMWFLNRAVELGVTEIVTFANSPLERLTVTGNAHGDVNAESKSNLPKENYEEYAKYYLDVMEHFVDEGIPVKFISPINEPQWDWTSGQEGCHYTPEEVVALLKVFIQELEKRPKLAGMEISAPESGEWGNTNYPYMEAIFADEELSAYFTSIDNHSYWSDANAKSSFKTWMQKKGLQNLTLRTSEWCEMVNGKDCTMDSAVNLAMEINDDLTILDVVSWQYWIGVSCYDYRDGLIYVTKLKEVVMIPKRLWAMGNFSKFVLPGYQRVEAKTVGVAPAVSAFTSKDGKLVLVFTNTKQTALKCNLSELIKGKDVTLYVTDATHNLQNVSEQIMEDGFVNFSPQSVNTLVIE